MKRITKSMVALIILSILLLSTSCGIKQDEAYIYQANQVASSIPFPLLYNPEDGEVFVYGVIQTEIYRYSRTTGEPSFKITVNYGTGKNNPDLEFMGQSFCKGTLYLVCPDDDGHWWHWDISLSELTSKSSLLWWQ